MVKNWNFAQKLKLRSQIEILLKKLKLWSKIKVKRNFAQKFKLWSKIEFMDKNLKIENFLKKIKIMVKNWKFGKNKLKLWVKIEILTMLRNMLLKLYDHM